MMRLAARQDPLQRNSADIATETEPVSSSADEHRAAADSALDALIGKIHGLSGGRTPVSASQAALLPAQPVGPGRPQDAAAGSPSSRSADSQRQSGREKVVPRPNPAIAAEGDFTPSVDEPWRPHEPQSLDQSGLTESLVSQIALRFLLNVGECEGRGVADQLKLPFRIIEPLLAQMKYDQLVAYKSATSTGDYVYLLTEAGRLAARGSVQMSTYYGACPVRLSDYVASIKAQSIEGQAPNREDLRRAFSDLLINQQMFDKLGPAISSGRGMFLFGYPGNGKTSIAERVTAAFGKYIWIPRAIEVDGSIMRVFDPMVHQMAMPEMPRGLIDTTLLDKRWVRIKRPTVVVGGELTMEMLEVQRNESSNISEAPLQLKSNCGTLVIDDFGRQKMSVDQLLNRWIIPLEKRYDFLNLAHGKKIQVPFDQLVIFSTNLEPKDLVDDAFLRRIPYKIEVTDPSQEDFRKLFEIMCGLTNIPFQADAVDYLIRKHYLPVARPFRNCQPRDLLLQVKNYCLYNELPIELKPEYLDFAVDNYFSVM